ncbi:MAG TPA: glycosyl hydrolase [Solirubrobacterales bacterium]|nr:glycosyl hydrolase [Solirubrobacterales bacterium]
MTPPSAALVRRLLAPPATCLLLLLLPAAAARAAPISLGVFVPDVFEHPGRVAAYGKQVGRQPVIVLSYKNWSVEPFYEPELERLWDGGAVPLVTWEPETADGEGIPLREIVERRHDRYIRRAAEAAAAWGKPIMLRFAQEMNGDWYPWGHQVDGNTPRLYREAWHRVFWIFRNHGADNVKWVWSPNADAGGGHPLAVFYPGDEFVDWVGIDGFCWGGDIGWPSFTAIFGSTYDRIVGITSKPIMIAETAAGEEGGNKAEWIASALEREAPAFPNIRALVWFNDEDPKGDLRVDSSPAALTAFRKAIASPTYGGTRRTLLATPASLPPGSAAPAEPSGGYGAPSLLEELRLKLHGRYLVLAIAIGVAVLILIVAVVSLFWRRRSRRARTTRPARAER